jgi:hypothetical protein
MAVGHDSLAQGDRHAGSASARWEGSSREERNGRGCSASCSWWVRQPARLRFAMSCASQPLCRPLPCSLRSLVMSVSRPFCSRRLTLAPITLQAARDARSPPAICPRWTSATALADNGTRRVPFASGFARGRVHEQRTPQRASHVLGRLRGPSGQPVPVQTPFHAPLRSPPDCLAVLAMHAPNGVLGSSRTGYGRA